MYERLTDSVTYYVVFDKCHNKHWWKHFLHKDFQHVLLWRQAGAGSILVNPLSHALCVRHCDQSIEEAIENEITHQCTAIVSITVHYNSFYQKRGLEIFTCVSLAKRLLCLRKGKTPKQLYFEMIKAGGAVIKPWCIM